MISMGSIEQFRSVIHNIQKAVQYLGYDEEKQEPIMDRNATKPKVTAVASEKIHGCLHRDTLVTTLEYGDIPIGSIIDEDLKCSILTFNHDTNENEWNKILNKWKTIDPSKKWYKLTTEEGQTLILTGNHEVWCSNRNDYIRCDELTDNDI